MILFDFSQNGGFPMTQDVLLDFQNENLEVSKALLACLPEDVNKDAYILNGIRVTVSGGQAHWSAGYVLHKQYGILKFLGQSVPVSSPQYLNIQENNVGLMYEDGIIKHTKVIRTLYVGSQGANTIIDLSNSATIDPHRYSHGFMQEDVISGQTTNVDGQVLDWKIDYMRRELYFKADLNMPADGGSSTTRGVSWNLPIAMPKPSSVVVQPVAVGAFAGYLLSAQFTNSPILVLENTTGKLEVRYQLTSNTTSRLFINNIIKF